MTATRTVSDLTHEIESLQAEGYRLDMIMPADDPREALLSRNGANLRLVKSEGVSPPVEIARDWVEGRAGMQYRDLIPGRLGGRLIASHIRITKGGEVPDYAHYHKIEFQIIYCKEGWIKVVYEDQGPPFVIEPGDCVLQPSGIRHRVLEASAGAEVIEVSSPAIHETWIEHEIKLPTRDLKPNRVYSGQRFVRHIVSDAVWSSMGGAEVRDLGVRESSSGLVDAKVIRTADRVPFDLHADGPMFVFVLNGSLSMSNRAVIRSDECVLIPAGETIKLDASPDTQFLRVSML